jgi:hypothetical protein
LKIPPCVPDVCRIEEMMESSSSARSSTTATRSKSIPSSVRLAFSAARQALELDLADIRSCETSTAFGASRSVDDDDDDCDCIAAELDHLNSLQESFREELSQAEDCWRQSSRSLIEMATDEVLERNVAELERDAAPDDDSDEALDEEHENEVTDCHNVDQVHPATVVKDAESGPEQLCISSLKTEVQFRRSRDDEALSTEGYSLQLAIEDSSCSDVIENSDTRRIKPLTIETESTTNSSTATSEHPSPQSPIQTILSSDLLHTGHGCMSLALASDILASQLYSQQSLLPCWLNTQLAVRCGSEKLSPTKTHWLFGVPLIGSAAGGGQVFLMGDDSEPGTRTSWVQDETLDDMDAF